MARIDRFVEALFQRGADRMVLVEGEQARLFFGDAARPITASALHAKLLGAWVEEIVPDELADEMEQPGEHRFEHVGARGAVSVTVSRSPELRIEVTPRRPERETEREKPRRGASHSDVAQAAAPVSIPSAEPADDDDVESVTSGPRTAAMDELFRLMAEEGCSDLHLTSGCPPLFRKDGGMVNLGDREAIPAARAHEMLYSITPPRRRAEFEASNDSDFSYEIPGVGRFRCNLFRDRKGVGGVFRIIPSDILTAEDLHLSPFILQLCHLKKGLIVVTGPTGSGKSTTLAALVDYINRNRPGHIITIEDPIEFVHENKQCLINQREIGNHTEGFKPALRAALREDPDIVLVGEMRDLETVEIALETAETGHLVFGTLHTNTAPSTVDRVIDQFPTDRQAQIRVMLASSLRAVVAQTLCKKKGGGRVAALEVLIANHAVSNLIREGKTFQIGSIMQTGRKLGMVTLNDALLKLVTDGEVEPDEACAKAVDRAEFRRLLSAKGFQVEAEE